MYIVLIGLEIRVFFWRKILRFEITPDPNLLDGLTHAGHNFRDALADIIDNSVDANATTCIVRVDADKVVIADDGCGMDSKGLTLALTFGKSTKNQTSKGRFGIGLKSAGGSIGKSITLLSSKGNDLRRAVPYWAEWQCEVDFPTIKDKALYSSFCKGDGTVVLLEGLRKDWKSRLEKSKGKTTAELGRIFRRIINNGFNLEVNGKKIKAVEPLTGYRKEWLNQTHSYQCLNAKDELVTGSLQVRVVEMDRRKVDSPEDCGFYILRNNREIARGQTLGFFEKTPEFYTFRCEISFDSSLDELFSVDFRKSGHETEIDWETMAPTYNLIKKTLEDFYLDASAQIEKLQDEQLQELFKIECQNLLDCRLDIPTLGLPSGKVGGKGNSDEKRETKIRHFLELQHLGENAEPWCSVLVGDGTVKIISNVDSQHHKKCLCSPDNKVKAMGMQYMIIDSWTTEKALLLLEDEPDKKQQLVRAGQLFRRNVERRWRSKKH